MIWILKGPGPEMAERFALALPHFGEGSVPRGANTWEEACHIAEQTAAVVYVATSAYHVPRAYLTLMAAFRKWDARPIVHVWGAGVVTNLQAQREAMKLADAQAKGHALRWEDVE